MQKKFNGVLVEGAGGLLSPLGENFDSRDLITALRATPVIVAPNQLGVVNHIRLTLEALPKNFRAKAVVVLMTPAKPDSATASNAGLLQKLQVQNICQLPWFGARFSIVTALKSLEAQANITAIADAALQAPPAA